MEQTPQSERRTATKKLVSFALSEVERKYGKGQGDGLTPLKYHNLRHSQDILWAGQQLADLAVKNGKISQNDVDLIEIATASHDIEQGLGGGTNELGSARIIEEKMRKAQVFTEVDIGRVKKMILATTVYFKDGVMKQSATDDYLTQIVADADLAHLGRESEIYWDRTESLLKEMKKTDNPSPEDKLTFMKSQPTFLENHKFYTEEAKQLFPHKQANIAFVQAKIQQENL
ncbi:MAG: HD domain-containing protein [Patescibacteria group bacterium]